MTTFEGGAPHMKVAARLFGAAWTRLEGLQRGCMKQDRSEIQGLEAEGAHSKTGVQTQREGELRIVTAPHTPRVEALGLGRMRRIEEHKRNWVVPGVLGAQNEELAGFCLMAGRIW